MGAIKRVIRADVRRAARVVLHKFYEDSAGKAINKAKLNDLVKKTEKEVVPAIMSVLRGREVEINTGKSKVKVSKKTVKPSD
jgi:hypothetical protein